MKNQKETRKQKNESLKLRIGKQKDKDKNLIRKKYWTTISEKQNVKTKN